MNMLLFPGATLAEDNQAEIDPRCHTCGRRAAFEVFDAQSRSCGYFCKRCGKKKLKAVRP